MKPGSYRPITISSYIGKLLEIACFDGYLLKKLNSDGWDIYGCDPSSMTKVAVEDFGEERIINDFFTEKTFPPETFDVVIFRNLLEHLYDIHSFIQINNQTPLEEDIIHRTLCLKLSSRKCICSSKSYSSDLSFLHF